jgi:hypothetical protein
MLVGKLLAVTIATLSGIAVAAPGDSGDGMTLLNRGNPHCKPGMTWVGFKQKCKCKDDGHCYFDDDKFYDAKEKRCHPKPHAKQQCNKDEKQYCVRDDKWCEYGELEPFLSMRAS